MGGWALRGVILSDSEESVPSLDARYSLITLSSLHPSEDPMLPLTDDPWATRDAARRARYRELLDFYEGRQWLGKPLPGERRLTANYARALVRKVASYLFPEPVLFSAVPDGADEAAQARALRAEAALAAVYAANDLAAVDFNAAI